MGSIKWAERDEQLTEEPMMISRCRCRCRSPWPGTGRNESVRNLWTKSKHKCYSAIIDFNGLMVVSSWVVLLLACELLILSQQPDTLLFGEIIS